MNNFFVVWVDFGVGKKKEVIDQVVNLNGFEWFKIFKNYYVGVMLVLVGDKDGVCKYLIDVIIDKDGGVVVQDVYVCLVIVLVGFEVQNGEKQKVFDVLVFGEGLMGCFVLFQIVCVMIEKGELIKVQVVLFLDGVGVVFFLVGSVLNQLVSGNVGMCDNVQEIVVFYLNVVLVFLLDSVDVMIFFGNVVDGVGKLEKVIEYYCKVDVFLLMYCVLELQLGFDFSQIGKVDEVEQYFKNFIVEDFFDFCFYLVFGSVYVDKENYVVMVLIYDDVVKVIGLNLN